MLGRLITRRLLSNSVQKKCIYPLNIKVDVENNIVKDIKVFPELIGKNIHDIKNCDKTYHINTDLIKEAIQKQLNKNIHLL